MQLTLQMDGLEIDRHHVRLEVFTSTIMEFRDSMNSLLRESGIETPSYYNVVSLSHSSPACATIEPIYKNKDTLDRYMVSLGFLMDTVQNILSTCTAPDTFNTEVLKKLRDVFSPFVKAKLSTLSITTPGKSIDFDRYSGATFVKNVDAIIKWREEENEADMIELGEITGMLESFTAHDGKNECVIYPIISNKGIKGLFNNEKIPNIIACLCKYVTVKGEIFYKANALQPYKIEIMDISVMPDEKTLPDFEDLLGISCCQFDTLDKLREIRNEWD